MLDIETLWLGRVDDFTAADERLRAADLTNRATHEANHNTRSIDEILVFGAGRAKLVDRLEALDVSVQRRAAPIHG